MRHMLAQSVKFYARMLAVLFFSLTACVVVAQDDTGYALLLQSSPQDAGTITPGNGVHKIQVGQTVQLSAIPRQGYRFLYWLGDVGSAGAIRTTVQLDSPKLVIAVFERERFDDLKDADIIAGSAQGGLYNSNTMVSSGGGISGGSYPIPDGFSYPTPPEQPEDDDFPVPDDEKIPEPATMLLLGLGAFLIKTR